jgi:hypothetical protein
MGAAFWPPNTVAPGLTPGGEIYRASRQQQHGFQMRNQLH